MASDKIKVSSETLARLVGDIHALTEVVSAQARTIQVLEARLAVCETESVLTRRPNHSDWWQKPVIHFQGPTARDAGEQANVI